MEVKRIVWFLVELRPHGRITVGAMRDLR